MVKQAQYPQGAILRRALRFYSPPPGCSDPEYIEGNGEESGRRNYPHTREGVLIRDIRGHEKSFTLDEHSFAALLGVFDRDINFTEPTEITEKYVPWVKELIRQYVPQALDVTVFN